MKYIAITYGTEGDARPLAALCRALIDAGHEARLLADAATLGSAHALGVPTTALAGDIKGALQPGGGISGVVAGGDGFTATAKALARIANANTEAWLRTTMDAAADAGCDALIVSGLAAFVGLSAAERLGVKAIGTGPIPITPTAAFPSPFLPPAYVPRMLNRASHRFVNAMLWRAFRKATNHARERVCGLAPRGSVWTDHPMLYGVSPALLPRPGDWPANAHVCGQWSMPTPEWSPPQALQDFLGAGEAPVYVGFGSMVGFDRERLPDVVAEAVAGRRTLFNPGWSGADTAGLPDNIFVVGEAPHAWLFPRTSLVVHHGGSGTTHSAARAGVPSVVVPFAGDQPFWAARLREAGVAGDPVDATPLRPVTLTRGIEFAERAGVRARARALGEAMAKEDGLATAVPLIEALASR
ncbi:UDP-glucose--sterol glucosyltransferase [Pseudoxanthomonas yeongjuensis]|uniref:glycosyltransferase n=1 Tax=Pseudoxanthomonas yeongjuensis TaxID=377616 RepID=UPI001391C88E|nr:glycosyltransferase [Pseudoxanthomonas yeongjuensis]KAF1714679.1 UDP-glucose--sterol glucosyltransferase [Pseudoxanthomonas yeongjuensis]